MAQKSVVIPDCQTLRDCCPNPGANIKEFLVTILSEAERPQTQCLSPKGEF